MKTGDIVTISPDLEDLETANKPYPFGLNSRMLNLRGRQAKIMSVITDYYHQENFPDYPNCDGHLYKIDLDNSVWSWANIMFGKCIGLKIVDEEL